MAIKNESPQSAAIETDLIQRIEAELQVHRELRLTSKYYETLTRSWAKRILNDPQRFINDDYTLNVAALKNFRRLQLLVFDFPRARYGRFHPKRILDGRSRGYNKLLTEFPTILESLGYHELLKRYPCHPAGNPQVFEYAGYRYTYRWARHIYLLGLLKKTLGDRLAKEFVSLDLGSSYGIFSSVLKKEYPKSHHVLVDFPEQLILAYYFLGTCLPQAKIAGVREFRDRATITREFIENYDFVLVPVSCYQQIAPDTVDLYTNFASLAEMKREWFDYYLDSQVFRTAQQFFTYNRIQGYPGYDTDITILDYPIWEPRKKMHFAVSPLHPHFYRPHHRVFYQQELRPPFFEYIGQVSGIAGSHPL